MRVFHTKRDGLNPVAHGETSADLANLDLQASNRRNALDAKNRVEERRNLLREHGLSHDELRHGLEGRLQRDFPGRAILKPQVIMEWLAYSGQPLDVCVYHLFALQRMAILSTGAAKSQISEITRDGRLGTDPSSCLDSILRERSTTCSERYLKAVSDPSADLIKIYRSHAKAFFGDAGSYPTSNRAPFWGFRRLHNSAALVHEAFDSMLITCQDLLPESIPNPRLPRTSTLWKDAVRARDQLIEHLVKASIFGVHTLSQLKIGNVSPCATPGNHLARLTIVRQNGSHSTKSVPRDLKSAWNGYLTALNSARIPLGDNLPPDGYSEACFFKNSRGESLLNDYGSDPRVPAQIFDRPALDTGISKRIVGRNFMLTGLLKDTPVTLSHLTDLTGPMLIGEDCRTLYTFWRGEPISLEFEDPRSFEGACDYYERTFALPAILGLITPDPASPLIQLDPDPPQRRSTINESRRGRKAKHA